MAADLDRIDASETPQSTSGAEVALSEFEGETPGEGEFTALNDRWTIFVVRNDSATDPLVVTVPAQKDVIQTQNGLAAVDDFELTIPADDAAPRAFRLPTDIYSDVFGMATVQYVGSGYVCSIRFPARYSYSAGILPPSPLTFDPKVDVSGDPVELAGAAFTIPIGCAAGRNALWVVTNGNVAAKKLSIAGYRPSFPAMNFGPSLGFVALTDSTFPSLTFAPACVTIPVGTYFFVRPLGALESSNEPPYIVLASEGNAELTVARVDVP